jgi:HEAT repeat protein
MIRIMIGALLLPAINAGILVAVAVQMPGDGVVEQLRELPTPLPAMARSDGTIAPAEQRRLELYRELRQLGNDALPALSRGLMDPDVRIRKNVALVLNVLGGNWFDRSQPKMNLLPCLPALLTALKDSDASVRAWAAQAIGEIGPDAAEAVPALVTLLRNEDEGSRNSAAIGLRGIGRVAKDALPALRETLSDPSPDVRRFAMQAIQRIEER